MKKILPIVALGWSLILSPLSSAANTDDDELHSVKQSVSSAAGWMLVKDDTLHNIKAFAKQEDDKKFRTFRVEAVMDAPLETVARVQFDVDNIKKWFWSTSESRLLKKISDKEFYYYQVYRTPLVPDRDVVLHATIDPYTPQKGYMGYKIVAAPDYIEKRKGLVRMAAHDITFKFTPLDKEHTKIEFEGYIDPSGVSPAWAINFYQRKSPYISVIGMQRMIQKPEYRDSKEAPLFSYKE